VLRALAELWQGLRISPVYGEGGQPARWEMMRMRHRDALTTASKTGQVTAISLLVSMYLQSVYAATSEEIEIFLSPVTSRSRVREAVRGLSATHQIHALSMDSQTYYFLQNGLPEFATVMVPVADAPAAPLAERPKRRVHPLSAPPEDSVPASLPRPAPAQAKPERRAAPAAVRGGWKRPERSAERGGAPAWREKSAGSSGRDEQGRAARPVQGRGGPEAPAWRREKTAGPSTPLRSGRDDKGRGARPAQGRGGPPRSGPPGGSRPDAPPWREKIAGRAPRPAQGHGGPLRSGPPGGSRPGAPAWRVKSAGSAGREDKGRAARPGGFVRAGGAPRPGGGGEGRPSGGGRPPFKPRTGPPRSGPPKAGPRNGGKRPPGNFRARKPDRKKPGA
jgi:hypothetical protein